MAKKKTSRSAGTAAKKRPPSVVSGPGAKPGSARIPEVLEAEDDESPATLADAEVSPEYTEEELDKDTESEAAEAASSGELPGGMPSAELPDVPGERDLVPTSDLLARYMDEVRRYPLLDPEEEFALATRLR